MNASPTIFALSTRAWARRHRRHPRIGAGGRRPGRRAGAAAGRRSASPPCAASAIRKPARRSTTALVLWFGAPRTETGEDMAEFHVHGGPAVVKAMLAVLGRQPGCRLAEPGEFARRAFDNGKLDLAQVEGLADLVDAETEAQRRQALAADARGAVGALRGLAGRPHPRQRAGRSGDRLQRRRRRGERCHRGGARASSPSCRRPSARISTTATAARSCATASASCSPGRPNAGKSSLLNALARRDAAIVSEEAGTTRDVIEVRLDLDGLPVIVTDTAGIREAAGRHRDGRASAARSRMPVTPISCFG